MAIAFDAPSETFSNSIQTLNWFHTCSGSDRILWVGVMTSSTRSVSSVTYNGVALTSLTRSAGGQPVQLWYLIAPATGTNTISVSIGAPNSFVYTSGASYTGVKQSGQPDAQNTNSTSSSSVSTSVTTVADNSWVVLIARNDTDGNTNAGTNSTERTAGAAGTVQLYDSNGAVSPAGSFSMTVTNAGSYATTIAMASFSPLVSAASFIPRIIYY
jgi:hypothetical protein